MATQQRLIGGDGPGSRVVDIDIAERMEQSFLDYSMSVIVGRALPDVRDGLKPVQRRILYAMWEAGLRPDRAHRKCASAVGDVMKKYHPHGDASIYEALVRMAQEFSTRDPLVDGHGNFGSVDGDPAAAMRYTEARLSPLAMELLAGIDEDTVDFVPNYDGYETEPTVLPARFPNLLVNGSSGIAVGMATNIPPHNLGEVIDACVHLVRRPAASVDELMRIVRAPDFPTGARIIASDGIRDAYLTGRGAVTMEAIATTETRSGGLPRIIVTEIPYQVNKAALLERIADLVKDKKVEEIRDLRDESSRDGMRIVIELKRGEDPARVLDRLYALTDLRTNFNVNFVALVDGQPRTLGLRGALEHYLTHQRVVLTRRTTYRRERAAARAHVLEGLLVALAAIDEVIALIRAARSADVARGQLMERYGLTEVQANAILDMQLRRLAQLERDKLAQEHRELVALVAELDAILADPTMLDGLLVDELRALRRRHSTARRTRIVEVGEGPEADSRPVLEAQPVAVYLTAGGYIKALAARRTLAPHSHLRDPLAALVTATTEDTLLLVDAAGGGYRIALADAPVVTARHRGVTVGQLLGQSPPVPIVGAVVLREQDSVVTVSAEGVIKRTERGEYEGRTRTMVAAGVKEGDRLVTLVACDEEDHLILAHSGGSVIRFPVADVRPTGRAASGVSGLQVPAKHTLVAASVVPGGTNDGIDVVTIARDGAAKRTPVDEYPVQGRGGKGVQTGTNELAWCGVASALQTPLREEIVAVESAGLPVARRAAKLPSATPVAGAVVPVWTS